jgi:AAA domain
MKPRLWYPQLDVYDAIRRMSVILARWKYDPPSVERMYIVDFYFANPSLLHSTSLPQDVRTAFNALRICRPEKLFVSLPSAPILFHKMAEVQRQAIRGLAGKGLVDSDAISKGADEVFCQRCGNGCQRHTRLRRGIGGGRSRLPGDPVCNGRPPGHRSTASSNGLTPGELMRRIGFMLRQLRVLSRGQAVYSQPFQPGVNIIAGENGSGKSTIADFIFYALGGEFDDWKTAARRCDEVQAEVLTPNGVLTLKRTIESKQTPISVFFGPMVAAHESALDRWQRYPIRRQESRESFSQIMFRSSGLPEAQSEGASNITMHQILRLLYSDQRTPAPRLFRFELFDTEAIRTAVGELLCGSDAYEGYALELELRSLQKKYEDSSRELKSAVLLFPSERALSTAFGIDTELDNLRREAAALGREIDDVDELVETLSVTTFTRERRAAYNAVDKAKSAVSITERTLASVGLELEEISSFQQYLEDLHRKLANAEQAAEVIGAIDFIHCPSCLTKLDPPVPGVCAVCGSPTDPEEQQSKYLQIRLDIQSQLRESSQLNESRSFQRTKLSEQLRREQAVYKEQLSEFATKYSQSNSPREAFLAGRFKRIGQIEEGIKRLEEFRLLASKIEALSEQKDTLERRIKTLREHAEAQRRAKDKRVRQALAAISTVGVNILANDLPRQDEFARANVLQLEFGDDAILVDGTVNFAESSNVVLKNAALLAFLSAACKDSNFYHPRFLLMDNVEDKGMEQVRSHNFQRLIVAESDRAEYDHQIIYTTSMIDPTLANARLLKGSIYTKESRTLNFPNT